MNEMDWKALFKAQDKLDKHILQEKGLEGQDLLDMKKLALQVEVGELANEWRVFKFWKVDPQPRTKEIIECYSCNGTGDENYEANFESLMEEKGSEPYIECKHCKGEGKLGYRNPLLEEYVDCLHFFLGIGLEFKIDVEKEMHDVNQIISLTGGATTNFQNIFRLISSDYFDGTDWLEVIEYFIGLGTLLGFTQSQIEQAYWEKNKINYDRQESNY